MKKSFDQWMKEVDTAIAKKSGVTSADLPDCCYRDWFDDGVRPAGAASRAIKASDE
jgi:Family of unknown function (DUF5419)